MAKSNIEMPHDKILDFCRKWGITEFSLFGSVLSKDFKPESDIDVLVRFAEDAHWSLFDFVQMQDELKEIFGREVDLVEEAGMRNPFRRHSILSSKEIIYAA